MSWRIWELGNDMVGPWQANVVLAGGHVRHSIIRWLVRSEPTRCLLKSMIPHIPLSSVRLTLADGCATEQNRSAQAMTDSPSKAAFGAHEVQHKQTSAFLVKSKQDEGWGQGQANPARPASEIGNTPGSPALGDKADASLENASNNWLIRGWVDFSTRAKPSPRPSTRFGSRAKRSS